jgi:hypothetical protein
MPTENVLGTIATILTVALIWAIVAYRSNRAARLRAGTPLAGTPLLLVLGNAVACLALAAIIAIVGAFWWSL